MSRMLPVLLLVVTAIAYADVGPVGPEFDANTSTGSDRSRADVAGDATGRFVVVWEAGSYYAPGDGSREGIFGRRFDATGAPVGGEFQVNTYTPGSQYHASVGMDAGGDFVVAWSSGGYYQDDSTQDGSAFGVFLQRFDVGGQSIGGEQQVNTYTRGNQLEPDVAMAPDGRFVVAWSSNNYYATPQDGDDTGVFGQRFAADGVPAGGEFQANTYTTGAQDQPAVTMLSNGGFVVVWTSQSFPVGQDGSRAGVFGQRFDAAGARAGAEFQVNTYTPGSQYLPDVAAQPAGDFVVTWQNGRYYGDDADGSGSSISMRRFGADGSPRGNEVQVNTFTPGDQRRPAVAADAQGNFVVSWENGSYYGGPDGSGSGIAARHFTAGGTALGDDFQVNTYTSGSQYFIAAAPVGADGFVVTWQGYKENASTISGQRLATTGFTPPVPLDGTTLTLKDAPNPAKRKLVVTSRDIDVTFGGLAGSIDDPTIHGGSLRVRSATFDDTYPLPAANWRPVGPGLGYEYRDPRRLAGPIVRVRVRAAQVLDVRGQGAGLGHTLAANPRPVTMQLQLGTVGQRSCTVFDDGAYAFRPGKSFKAKHSPAPGACPR